MATNSSLEMYELDLVELNKFIESSTRPNLKRHLETHRTYLLSLFEEEKKKLAKINGEENKGTSINSETSSNTKVDMQMTTITKYLFENTDKFAK